MAEKRVSVRFGATGGDRVEAELKGVADAGERGFGRLSKEVEAAGKRLDGFARRAKLAAAAVAAATAAAAGALVKSGLDTVDAQAKLAQSLDTTVESIQTLERAGELAGVSMSGIEQATKDLTRRLSQAASGGGPAADALTRLGLSARELMDLPLDQRVQAINEAILEFVPAAERATVAGKLFGEEGSIAMARVDTATLRQASLDVRAFGVAVSEMDADQIERTNDAVSRLGLVWRGLANRLAVAVAPALEDIADAMAVIATQVIPAFGAGISAVSDNIDRLATYAATFAALMAGRWVAGMAAAALSVKGLAATFVILRGAIIRTGIGVLIVGAGELVFQFGRLVRAAGGFGEALDALQRVASEVWERINLGAGYVAAKIASVALEVAIRFTHGFATIAEGWASLMRGMGIEAGGFAEDLQATVFRLSVVQADVNAAAAAMGDAFTAPMESVAALRALVSDFGEDGAASVSKVTEALADLGDEADDEGGKGGGKGSSGKSAKSRVDSLKDSAERLSETMQGVKSAVGGAFSAFVNGTKRADAALADMLASLAQVATNRAFDMLFGVVADGLTAALSPSAAAAGAPVSYLGAGNPMPVYKAAGGGHIAGPGTSTSDSIPALLSDGEFVVNAAATSRHRALLEMINRGGEARRLSRGGPAGPGVPQAFRSGGPVSGGSTGSGAGGGLTLQIINNSSAQVAGEVQEATDVSGRRVMRLEMADAVGQAMTTRGGGGRRALRQQFGIAPVGTRR
ncbi:hypothetical protein SAMN05444336_112122 [Albimonas donghaensis]|uniref:Phage tail tape measure protein, lambda family n=1 Tax=Albimonas donghaensis TaxID=356660 RepID=A0A1H3FHZ8_9RHOB|nr:phage tail tape measure protein [Albimonas donghaensis]SDX90465.1 hypothetical protein SAMN05444336_112122 [Albimonas donghaensis]